MFPLPFVKMHAQGNDFIVIGAEAPAPDLFRETIAGVCHRRFGLGCDQLIVILPSDKPGFDARIRFFNADGSESGACGNGTRCVGRLLADLRQKDELRLTCGGRDLSVRMLTPSKAEADLGRAERDWRKIPLAFECDTDAVPVDVEGLARPRAVSMGNPHLVFITDHPLPEAEVRRRGPELEHHPIAPERANIGFLCAEPDGEGRYPLTVWERGSGLTYACGTGACAAFAAGESAGLFAGSARFLMPGGELAVRRTEDGTLALSGETFYVAKGTLV